MAVKIEDLEEYATAHDAYVAALTTAKAAGDELAETKAELGWRDARDKLRDTAEERNTQQRAVEMALEQVKKDYPKVPEIMFKRLTDPEEILQVAKEANEAIEASSKSRSRSWSTPTAAPAQASAKPNDKYDDPDYLADLNKRFGRKDSRDRIEAADEVFGVLFDKQVMPHFERAIQRGQAPERQ
jgi:DNA-binding protein H-NS